MYLALCFTINFHCNPFITFCVVTSVVYKQTIKWTDRCAGFGWWLVVSLLFVRTELPKKAVSFHSSQVSWCSMMFCGWIDTRTFILLLFGYKGFFVAFSPVSVILYAVQVSALRSSVHGKANLDKETLQLHSIALLSNVQVFAAVFLLFFSFFFIM